MLKNSKVIVRKMQYEVDFKIKFTQKYFKVYAKSQDMAKALAKVC